MPDITQRLLAARGITLLNNNIANRQEGGPGFDPSTLGDALPVPVQGEPVVYAPGGTKRHARSPYQPGPWVQPPSDSGIPDNLNPRTPPGGMVPGGIAPMYPGPGYTNPAAAGQWANSLANWQGQGWYPNVADPEAAGGQ